MIKLIVSDMDGTLFNSNQKISPFNLAAIKAAEQDGVPFMIATGRSIDTIYPTVEEYGLQCGLILLNGAEIRDADGNMIHLLNIDGEKIWKISKALEEQGYIPEYITNKGAHICGSKETMELNMGYRMLCLDRQHTLSLEEAIELGKTSVFQQTMTRNNSVEEMLTRNLEIRKIIVFHPDIESNKRNRLALTEEFPEFTVLSSYPENIEINHKNAKKGLAILSLIEEMGIAKEEVAVFGDGLNDLSMFELFPNSYAPANAEVEIKLKAKEIIPPNYEDGVGKKINELLYLNKVERMS